MTKNGDKRGELTAFARKAGISPTYAFEIKTGMKRPPLETAARIFAKTGQKFGILAHPAINPRDIQAVVRVLRVAGQLAA